MTDAPPTHDLSAIKRQQRRAERTAELAPLISLAALVGFFAIASDSFLGMGTLGQVLAQGSVLAIAAAGLTFVLLSAEIDLAVGMLALWTAAERISRFCAVRLTKGMATSNERHDKSARPNNPAGSLRSASAVENGCRCSACSCSARSG